MMHVYLEIPDDLISDLEHFGVSTSDQVSDWLLDAARKVVKAEMDLEQLQQGASRGSPGRLKRLLASVPAVEPEECDRVS